MKEKACVSLISHVFSMKIRFTLLSAVYFCCVLGTLRIFLAIWREFDDRYPKKPLSVTKWDINVYQSIFISLWFNSTAQDLAAKIHQKLPLSDQKWEFYDTTLFAGTTKPWKWLAQTMSYNISESQKRRDIHEKDAYFFLNDSSSYCGIGAMK